MAAILKAAILKQRTLNFSHISTFSYWGFFSTMSAPDVGAKTYREYLSLYELKAGASTEAFPFALRGPIQCMFVETVQSIQTI